MKSISVCLCLGLFALFMVIGSINIARGSILFEDDFSKDKGWISSPSSEIYYDAPNGAIVWHARRDRTQYMYHGTPIITGDFTIKVDGIIDKRTNNCWIEIGLSDRTEFTSGKMNGISIMFGWFGGGTRYHHYYAYVRGQYKDGSKFTSTSGHITPNADTWSGYINLSEDTWYRFNLTRKGKTWILLATNVSAGIQVGSLSGTFDGNLPPLKYVYFSNLDQNDWPTMNGRLDNISISIDEYEESSVNHPAYEPVNSSYIYKGIIGTILLIILVFSIIYAKKPRKYYPNKNGYQRKKKLKK